MQVSNDNFVLNEDEFTINGFIYGRNYRHKYFFLWFWSN